jgi:hypothetical protein
VADLRNWSEEEGIQALDLYLRTPFGRIHSRNPEIASLAAQLGRTAGAVALKMVNFAALDPDLPRKGMGNVSATDRRLWSLLRERPAEFLDRLAAVAEPYVTASNIEYGPGAREGQDVISLARRRRGQDYFRSVVLANYGERCAVTGMDDARLLTASHIVRWVDNRDTRLDPANGLCLNTLHDRAFDAGLIAVRDDFSIVVSPRMAGGARRFFENRAYARIRLPEKIAPAREHLAAHRERFRENFAGVSL